MNEEKKAQQLIIIKKKCHKGGHAAHSSAWKIALADFAMAMMAFFILMWIITSTTEAEKLSISGYFQNPTAAISGYVPILIQNMFPITSPDTTASAETGKSSLETFLSNEQDKLGISNEDIVAVGREFEASIATGEMEVEVSGDRLTIRIMEHGSFPPGSAELCQDFIPILNKVAKVLHITMGKVTVSGYTDNVAIQTGVFRSNRELSVVRAVSVVEELLKDRKIQPERIIVRGFGENNPIASNDTSEGRAKNRRVELEIMQGEEPKTKNKTIILEKDADTKLIPNIEKTDAVIDSVFPPITDVDFDGNGEYLEKGELGVFDKDTLYNYELKDKVIKPQDKPKETLKPDSKEEVKKPDDLGLFKGDKNVTDEKKKPDELGLFKEQPTDATKQSKDDLGVYKGKEEVEPAKKKPNDLGIFKGNDEQPDPKDLGLVKKEPAKKAPQIEVEGNAVLPHGKK